MKSFMQPHHERILGTLSGFDRILFRGALRSISYVDGVRKLLSAKDILLKDFIAFAQQCTDELAAHAEQIALDARRPDIYLNSPSIRKEDRAGEIAERDGIKKGLICVLYCVEPCMGFDIHRNRKEKKLQLVSRQRKCRFSLGDIYPHLWQHAMTHFSTNDVMRFLGKKMTRSSPTEAITDMKRRPEGLRIKHAVDGNSIKMYDKEETVLRIETTINNPRWFRVVRGSPRPGGPALAWRPMRLGVSDIQRRVDVSLAANARYLEALAVVGEQTPSHQILDPVSKPVKNGRYRYRGLRPVCPDEARLLHAILQGHHLIRGFTNQDIRARLFPAKAENQHRQKRSAHVSRRLRLLRAHGLITKVPRRHLYRITKKGHEVMTTALLFRQTDAKLLLPKAAA